MTDTAPEACADAYRALRGRVTELVRATDARALDTVAPATPEWRVRDVLAHMVGVNTDIVHQQLDGVTTDAWTTSHVARRRDAPIEALLDEWTEHASTVEANAAFLGPAAGQWVLDGCTHEHDIRQALGVPGARGSDAVAIGVEWGADRLHEHFDRVGAPALRVETEAGTRTLGANEPADGLRTSRFELLRAMTGRRSVAQMSAYAWTGPPRPEHLLLAIFVPRPADLVE